MSSEYADLRHPEYQVVIIVDFDDGRLFPLTEQTPKCLLPIANKKLLAYQLDMLTKSGVTETYIVTPEDYEAELNHFLHDYVRGSMSIDLVVAHNMMGSADALRAVSDRIRGDFFCLGADFISQVSLSDMVNLHRLSVSDVTMMFSVPSKDSVKDDLDQEFVALSDEGRVLMKIPTLEIDEMINLSKHLLHKTSSFNLRNDLFDMGIYLMSHWIMEFVCTNHKFSSIRSDLIPYLVQRQFQPKDYLYEAIPPIEHRKRPLSSIESWINAGNLRLSNNIGFQTILDAREEENQDILRCFAIVYEPFASSNNAPTDAKSQANLAAPTPFLLTRLTNIPTYLNMNKEVPLIQYNSRTPFPRVSNYMKKELSVVGDNVDMGQDKTVTFKQCFIGNNCQIGQKTKLNNCVIMDNVIIGENCVIQNCVICERVVIENNCNLNECNIGMGYKITANSKTRGESFSVGSH